MPEHLQAQMPFRTRPFNHASAFACRRHGERLFLHRIAYASSPPDAWTTRAQSRHAQGPDPTHPRRGRDNGLREGHPRRRANARRVLRGLLCRSRQATTVSTAGTQRETSNVPERRRQLQPASAGGPAATPPHGQQGLGMRPSTSSRGRSTMAPQRRRGESCGRYKSRRRRPMGMEERPCPSQAYGPSPLVAQFGGPSPPPSLRMSRRTRGSTRGRRPRPSAANEDVEFTPRSGTPRRRTALWPRWTCRRLSTPSGQVSRCTL